MGSCTQMQRKGYLEAPVPATCLHPSPTPSSFKAQAGVMLLIPWPHAAYQHSSLNPRVGNALIISGEGASMPGILASGGRLVWWVRGG